jgi:hypothetical protein
MGYGDRSCGVSVLGLIPKEYASSKPISSYLPSGGLHFLQDEPGVTRVKLGKKKKNEHCAVSASVAKRIHNWLSNAA